MQSLTQKQQIPNFNYNKSSPRARNDLGSFHLREHLVQSPNKVVLTKLTPREIELDRKVRVLEKRIAELHQEKHTLVGKMNE